MNTPSRLETPPADEPTTEAAGFGVMEDIALYAAIAAACFVLVGLFV